MNYDDFYLLRLIKKLQQQVAALESQIGFHPPSSGGSSDVYVIWQDIGPTPDNPPSNLTIPVIMKFRDGYPDKTWDPNILDWR